MDGTYRSSDLLLVWPHSDYKTGDIVVYEIPKGEAAFGPARRAPHHETSEQGHFTTQGDNRPSSDIWRPTVQDVVGKPFLRLPAGGLVLKWLLSPIALALLCAVCVYFAVAGKDAKAEEGSVEEGAVGEGDAGPAGETDAADEDAHEPDTVAPR